MSGSEPPRRLLAIDTAAPVVGAAVVDEGGTRSWEERIIRGADGALIVAVADLIEGPIDAVVVTTGPGAFTGLRVGVATALGLAEARGVGVVPVSSLQVRAALVRAPRVLSVLDAKKGRVYAGLFDGSGEAPTPVGPERDIDPDVLLDEVAAAGPFVAVGEGAVLLAERIGAVGGAVAPEPARSPATAAAGLVLAAGLQAIDPAAVALRYLRPAEVVARKPPGGSA